MCTTCGCGHGETRIDGVPMAEHHEHRTHRTRTRTPRAARMAPPRRRHVAQSRPRRRQRAPDSAAAAGRSAPRTPPACRRRESSQIEQDILAKNDAYAARNRQLLADRGIFALNLVSSPGSGKTTLLVRTIEALRGRMPVAVIEGDQQTSLDADRIRATGAPAVQVNTGKGCHLDAHMVGHALDELAPADGSLLLIENVGNLVCPAAFDLGEAHKVVILSVTEGDDKPLKYPDMFHAADLMLVNKVDLLPYVEFDVDAAIAYARRVRPGLAGDARVGDDRRRARRVARMARAGRRAGAERARRGRRGAAPARRRARSGAHSRHRTGRGSLHGPSIRPSAGASPDRGARHRAGRRLPAVRLPARARARARRLGAQRRRRRHDRGAGRRRAHRADGAPRSRATRRAARASTRRASRMRGPARRARLRDPRRAAAATPRRRSVPTARSAPTASPSCSIRRSPLSLRVHQLHELRTALHDHARACRTTAR